MSFGEGHPSVESFKLSPDPQLVDKIRDVVGLYTNPPTNAVVFSVDEKSQIQALERAQPVLPMDIGQPERRTHNYIRNGTLDLFAALNVATGEVLARCKAQHRAQDFVAFLREIEASVAPTLDIHVVLDNLSAQRRHPCSAGWSAIRGCSFISRRPTPRGSTSSTLLRLADRKGVQTRLAHEHRATPRGNPGYPEYVKTAHALQVGEDADESRQHATLASVQRSMVNEATYPRKQDPGD